MAFLSLKNKFNFNRELSGLFIFLFLFILVLILFIFLSIYTNLPNHYFYVFFIIALLFFIIDPFIKSHLPSFKANLLLLEIYIFFVHFAIVLSGESNSIFFFLYVIPIISAAMTFGIRGSVLTTIFIFIIYNLNETYTSTSRAFFGPQMQEDLPKFIALLIIGIMLGFSSEENRKAEFRAFERVSKILTLNEIRNSLTLETNAVSLIKLISNSIMKLLNCDAVCSVLLNIKENLVSEKFENNLQLSFFTNDALQFEDQPRLISKKDRHLIHNANSLKFFNVIKLSLKVDYDKYLIIFLTRKKERVLLSPSDLELTKSLKIYLDLLLKNQMLYKQIQQIKDDLFLTFKNLPIGIIILNNEMFIKSVNTQALLLLKYNDEKELIGKQLGGAIYIFPDLKIYEKIRKGEYLLFHKTQLSSKTLEIKQIELTITPLKDEYNNVIGRILSFNDITELKELEEELQRRDKLAALGQMTAGLAHEFRNPLAIIEGFASLLQKDLATDPEKYKLASKLVEGVNDLNRIVSEFLNFTNKIQLAPEARNIIDTIDRSLLFIRKMIEDNKIELIKNYNNFTKVIIEYDENKIKQVLLNILLNAIDALSEITAPQIVISLRLKDDYLANTSLFCIDIFNNGGNIDETIKNNIFNPFFTTKPSGIGLGLTISQKIVNEHNGKLYFKNEKNGVKFTIELPVDKRFVYKS